MPRYVSGEVKRVVEFDMAEYGVPTMEVELEMRCGSGSDVK